MNKTPGGLIAEWLKEELPYLVDRKFETIRIPQDGKDGKDGKDGRDGKDAEPAKDGLPGRDGKDGLQGDNGVGIALVEQRDDASFHIVLTDESEYQIDLPRMRRMTIAGGGTAATGPHHKFHYEPLFGLDVTILKTHHKVQHVTNVMVLNPDGVVTELLTTIFPSQDVRIQSLVELSGFTAVISGA